MQTTVTTFKKDDKEVKLHAMLHYGTSEYFAYYNDIRSVVLFELLVDEDLLIEDDNLRRLKLDSLIQATQKDRVLAQQYGWVCQADVVRYSAKWIHADFSRQELLERLPVPVVQANDRPLWKLASKERFPASVVEAATALMVGPPYFPATSYKRKLFSNLFVPGSSLAKLLRALLWFTVPSPELSILLLDWSSLNTIAISQMTLPLVEAIFKGDFGTARQLIFGQIVLLASKTDKQEGNDILVSQRNKRAIDVLLQQNATSIALLYGCNHCPDLQRRLLEIGYEPVSAEWRTAWSVRLQKDRKSKGGNEKGIMVIVLTALPLYLLLGGLDWISTWQDIFESPGPRDVSFYSCFYLLRHALLYSALSKYFLDFDESHLPVEELKVDK
jgi:hypothetical protein